MAEHDPPFTSVIVPVFNGEKTIRECLFSLLKMDYPAELREILVVDNGSTDGTARIIKEHPVGYLCEGRRGPSYARNRGIEASQGKILAFTDADCVASAGWLKELVREFRHETIGGVAGEVVAYPPKTPVERYFAQIRHLSAARYLYNPIFPFAMTGSVAFRREIFDRIGLFDPAFSTGEGADFFRRFFKQTAFKLQYTRKAIVFHRHRATARELFKQLWGYGKGHALLCIKYREEIQWSWRQSRLAYADLARAAGALAKTGLRYCLNGGRKEDLFFCFFSFLHKLAYRVGFTKEAISRGYLYF
ncbi:MAG: glycosyltransferase [Deltaproteobacteria bacterium]|nr:glycosyltransferase [Deltaproteobacteria bacterium]